MPEREGVIPHSRKPYPPFPGPECSKNTGRESQIQNPKFLNIYIVEPTVITSVIQKPLPLALDRPPTTGIPYVEPFSGVPQGQRQASAHRDHRQCSHWHVRARLQRLCQWHRSSNCRCSLPSHRPAAPLRLRFMGAVLGPSPRGAQACAQLRIIHAPRRSYHR